MWSSRPLGDGSFEITTPGMGYEVGRRFYVAGSPAAQRFGYGVTWPDSCLRLVEPLPPWRGRTSDQPNYELAQELLREQLRSVERHESLVEGPRAAA